MTEIYKIVNGVAPSIMNSFSELGNNEYNIGIFQVFSTDFRRTVNYGIETITYRAPSLWAKLPSEYKLAAFLKEFKEKLRYGNVTHLFADYAKKFNQILGLSIRNMVSKNVNLLCFTTIF